MLKILHLSDTHGQHRKLLNLPPADILVHSGDFTMQGTIKETLDFLEWLTDLPYPHKIFIAGNHDTCLFQGSIEGLENNIYYLANDAVTIQGLKFYGAPMFLNEGKSKSQALCYQKIPSDTDVLITHCPPFGILDFYDDFNCGSQDLLLCVQKVKPKLHLFGHIHKDHGLKKQGVTLFSNAAIMDESYVKLKAPNLFEL